ncbi:MAG: hypothetical protein ACLPKE_05925 [Streptosporangiaceae bacterium]
MATRHGRGIGFYLKAVGGVLTLAATIAGAYFAFRSQPATFGTADWVHQANAACEQDFGPLRLSTFDGLVPATATAGQNTSSSGQFSSKVQDWITEEGDLSKQVGDLAALQTPHDARAVQVAAVLNSGNQLVGSMDAFADVMQADVASTTGVSSTQVAAARKDGDNVLVALLAWQRALKTLTLSHCAFWTDSPASTPATLPPPSAPASPPGATPPGSLSSLDPGEQQLVSVLDPADLDNCTGRPDLEAGGVVAALNCEAVSPGPTLRPLVVQFSDIAAADTWFTTGTANFTGGDDCAAGDKLGLWTHNGVPTGPLGCSYTTVDGAEDFRMVWVIDNSLIGVIADGTVGSLMYDWWTNWCYVTDGR